MWVGSHPAAKSIAADTFSGDGHAIYIVISIATVLCGRVVTSRNMVCLAWLCR